MIMDENKFNATDSLKTIEAAINETKTTKTGAAFYYMLWGSILCCYFLIQFFIGIKLTISGSFLYSFNWILFPIGGFFSYLNKRKDEKNENYVPQLEKVYFFGFTGFAIMYAIFTFASTLFSLPLSIIFFPLISGLTVFVIGGISKHNISIFGGIFSMLLSIISILSNIEIAYLLASIACITSFIIPGITMRKSNV
ncbi:MAG: hypothetical protein RLZZ531_1655 [Bacteroidota bacterium]|jgi:hypothetical protein